MIRGFGCSECGWRFKPLGKPTGAFIEEMMRNLKLQRDKKLTSHHSLCRQITVELLRFRAVLQSPLLQFSGLGIYKSNLFEARVVVTTYDNL